MNFYIYFWTHTISRQFDWRPILLFNHLKLSNKKKKGLYRVPPKTPGDPVKEKKLYLCRFRIQIQNNSIVQSSIE